MSRTDVSWRGALVVGGFDPMALMPQAANDKMLMHVKKKVAHKVVLRVDLWNCPHWCMMSLVEGNAMTCVCGL